MVSTKTMSTSRLSRCATESKIAAAISPSASSRKSIARYAASSENPAQPAIATRSADPAGGGQLAARFQRPLCHQREQHPLGRVRVQAPVGGDPVQRCADAEPLPELVQQPRPAEAPRVQHLDLTGVRGARSPAAGRGTARSRPPAGPARRGPPASARPKLWITFAEGTPVTGWRSLCASCRYDTVEPSRLRRFVSRRYTPTLLTHNHW